jgi:hypothetical protein
MRKSVTRAVTNTAPTQSSRREGQYEIVDSGFRGLQETHVSKHGPRTWPDGLMLGFGFRGAESSGLLPSYRWPKC